MMYLTAKNAGKKTPFFILTCPFISIIDFKMCLNRVRQTRVTDLRGGGQSPSIPEEDPGSDRCSGGGPAQPKEPADGPPPHALRHHDTMYATPGFHLYFIYVCSRNPALTTQSMLFSLDTSRRPRDEELTGNSYHFTSRTEMEADVKAGRFLEHGEYDGNLYGTKIDSIHEVVDAGRTCILDVNPQVRRRRTSPF